VLPRFPRRRETAESIIARACTNAGYPEPVGVTVSHAPLLRGVPHSMRFDMDRAEGRPARLYMHAQIAFPCQLQGPVILGAGRYGGLGFCRPLTRPEELA